MKVKHAIRDKPRRDLCTPRRTALVSIKNNSPNVLIIHILLSSRYSLMHLNTKTLDCVTSGFGQCRVILLLDNPLTRERLCYAY